MAETPIIDDTNYTNFVNPIVDGQRMVCASEGVWSPGENEGYAGTFEDLASVPLIPESEWQDRIRQQERDKTRLIDLANDMGMHIRNQAQTNYCWAFGTCRSAEYAILQTGINRFISPASVAAPIKNFANQGGWGDQALDYMARNGFNLDEEWPQSSRDRRYYSPDNRALAKKRVVTEYYKLTPGRQGWAEVVSCILAGLPVAVGFNWWRHLVCGTWLTTNLEMGIDNSWGTNWGNNGRGLLSGSRKYPDGAVVVTAVRAM